MTGNESSLPPETSDSLFYLDECLPFQIAEALSMVGYPITSWKQEFDHEGEKDPKLVPYLAKRGLIWITKDDKARIAHEKDIEEYRISVVWVRGISRQKGQPCNERRVRMKDVHMMLVSKLDDIAHQVATANGPRYFILYMNAKKTALVPFATLKNVTKHLQNTRGRSTGIPSKI